VELIDEVDEHGKDDGELIGGFHGAAFLT
jgi:hypothetical protein